MSSSGSTLCRRLWIKHLCYDIFQSHHTRFVSPATRQSQRMLSQVNYQPPPSFLTPTYTSTAGVNDAIHKHSHDKGLPVHLRKALEQQISQYVKANQIDRAHRSLQQIYHSGHTPTVSTYNRIIKALAKQFQHQQRRIEAHALLEDMIHRGVMPNDQTHIQMILGYTIHTTTTTHPDTLSKIQLLFDDFMQYERERGFKRTHHKIKKVVEVMAGVGHGALLYVMESSMAANIKLDVGTWNSALAGCVKAGDTAGAEQLLEIMRLSAHSIPNATSYHTVIAGYLNNQGGGLNSAIEVFQKMMNDQVVADYRIYRDFMCAYATDSIQNATPRPQQQGTSVDTLQRLWQAMMTTMTDGQKVGDKVLGSLLDYYLRNHCYSAMEQVYWDLRQHGFTFSKRSALYFHKAIHGFAQRQHLISGIAMFYDLLAYGHGANYSSTASLLRACVLRGQLDMAQQILDVMEETLQQPASVDHYATMVRAYIQQGQLESANRMFLKVRQLSESHQLVLSGQVSVLASYQAMIRGYFNQHQGDIAQSLFEQLLQQQQQQQQQQQYKPGDGKHTMDTNLIGVMVEGYGRLGETKKLDDFLGRDDVVLDDLRTRAILVQARLDLGDVDGAERDLKEGLEANNIQSLRSSIQAVLFGLALNGNVASCEYWVDQLSSSNLMDDDTQRALLVCYGKAGETVKLKQAYVNLNQQGIKLADGIKNKIKSEWLKSSVQS